MGLNISVNKITSKTFEETFSFEKVPVYWIERQEWFDYMRHSGDSDFVENNEFFYVDLDSDKELQRPVDFNKTIQWVNENIHENNKQRLIQALEKMKCDETLVFCFSF